MRSTFLYLILVLTVAMYCACASQVSPNGGPKDNTPPQLISANPENKSTGFKAEKIVLEFDEFFKVKDASKILVSPPISHKPVVKVKQKQLSFIILDSLAENTTYTINFGETIEDITEGNQASNFKYVFSTGAYLDSMEIKGRLSRAVDNKTDEGWLVLLYDKDIDSLPLTTGPYYYTRTDKQGNFHLTNLRPGKFKIFGLVDQNFNYLYDLPNEEIAFSDTLVNSQISASPIELSLFDEADIKEQKLLRAWAGSPGIMKIVLNKGSSNITLNNINPAPFRSPMVSKPNSGGDTITYYIPDVNLDSVRFIIVDSGVNIDTTTVELKKIDPDTLMSRKMSISEGMIPSFNENTEATYGFSYPLSVIDTHRIMLLRDSLIEPVSFSLYYSDSSKTKVNIKSEWQQGSKYKLIFKKACFQNIHGQNNDSILFLINVRSNDYLGNINLSLVNYKQDMAYIARLKNKKGDVSRETFVEKPDTVISWKHLEPGDYSLEVIEDWNKNKKWDPGHYENKRQSETIHRYEGKIQVRAKWEMDLEIKL